MALFVYQLTLSEKYHDMASWGPSIQETLQKHAEYLQAGVKSGRILIVGRTEAEPRDNFGIVVFKSSNAGEAKEQMEGDPAVRNGVMPRIFPFKLHMVTDEAKSWNIWQ